MKTFNLTASGWNTLLGDTFRVVFGFDGTNADSYDAGTSHVKFQLLAPVTTLSV